MEKGSKMNKPNLNVNIDEAQRTDRVLDLIMLGHVSSALNINVTGLSQKSMMDYKNVAATILGVFPGTQILIPPENASNIIDKISTANKVSTLKKQARAMTFITRLMLYKKCQRAFECINNGRLKAAEKIVLHPSFQTLITLAEFTAATYRKFETKKAKRLSKKTSLKGLPENWRERLADSLPHGHFTCPVLALLLTGARPAEIENGIEFIQIGTRLRVIIRGVKVTKNAGQEWRSFDVADGLIKHILLDLVDSEREGRSFTIQVKNGNSLTTHIRRLCKKLWPQHTKDITSYSIRHAIASDCKYAIAKGADPDLASKVLGHTVDKTATYYGSHAHGGGGVSLAPSRVEVSRAVKNKLKQRLANRKLPGSGSNTKHVP